MNVKDAVKKAIEYISDVFKSEKPENIGLEGILHFPVYTFHNYDPKK